mmetsp:Transcript_20636/g.37157  ORF Transcript_20636/g.37157 Transcript_20636/m.37157 type:complete len:100 (+) Transcript_20636:309-608(+)
MLSLLNSCKVVTLAVTQNLAAGNSDNSVTGRHKFILVCDEQSCGPKAFEMLEQHGHGAGSKLRRQGSSDFVEQRHPRLTEQGPRCAKQLALALRQRQMP